MCSWQTIPACTDLRHTHGHWSPLECSALVLLATQFLRQARMPWMPWAFLASWHTVSWWSATVNWHCQVLFCQTPFQPLCPEPVALQGICDPGESPGTWPFWTPYKWPWPLNPACSDSSAEPSCFPAEHSHPAWCHLWTYWKCSQSPHSDHQ